MHATSAFEWPLPHIDGFELVRRIGGGVASTVFEARRAGRRVALKVVQLSDDSMRERFSREVSISSIFEHPSIVAPLEASTTNRIGWISMPMLDGRSLERAQSDPRLTFAERASAIGRVAHGLVHVHERGVLHCDVKPSNVFLTVRGRVKILDFGAALLAHEASKGEPCLYGTHHYVAPERIRGEPIDYRSDVFSLGVVAFEILTGKMPWQASNSAALLFAMCSKPPVSFRQAALASPFPIPRAMIGGLSEIIERTLARDPNKRFSSMAAFADAWSEYASRPEAHLPVAKTTPGCALAP